MLIIGARVALDAHGARQSDLAIRGDRFAVPGEQTGPSVDLTGYLLLPGLINAHDHLELPSGPLWGALRNLLAGVTTVAHHNDYDAAAFEARFPVRVVRDISFAQSLQANAELARLYRRSPDSWPFLLHASEGDIPVLDKQGILAANTILVHAGAISEEDLALVRRRGSSLVWCPRADLPASGATLSREALRSGVPVALGTETARTTQGDFSDELRAARIHSALTAAELYRMVTVQAARVLRLRGGQGEIRRGAVADLIAVRDEGQTPAEAIFDLRPEFVMVGGKFKLISAALANGPLADHIAGLQELNVGARGIRLIDSAIALPATAGLSLAGRPLA